MSFLKVQLLKKKKVRKMENLSYLLIRCETCLILITREIDSVTYNKSHVTKLSLNPMTISGEKGAALPSTGRLQNSILNAVK